MLSRLLLHQCAIKHCARIIRRANCSSQSYFSTSGYVANEKINPSKPPPTHPHTAGFTTSLRTQGAEDIKNQSSKLIDEIQAQKKRLDEETQNNKSSTSSDSNSTSSTASASEFINTIINSENFQKLKDELAKYNETRTTKTTELTNSLSEKITSNVKELRKSISILSKVVNDVTGYTKVDKLKEMITAKENSLTDLRKDLLRAKDDYNNAIVERANSQKEVNELLERKHRWSPEDLEKFTNLYKNDHILEKKVKDTAARVTELELQEDNTYKDLLQSIMTRYHEEQLWSDKIRQFSTWGTLLIMAVNLLLVLVVQLILEPWKRSRLVSSFELKVKDMFDREETIKELNAFKEELKQELTATALSELQVNQQDLTVYEGIERVQLIPQGYNWESVKQWVQVLFTKVFVKPFTNANANSPSYITLDRLQLDYLFAGTGFLCLFIGILLGRL